MKSPKTRCSGTMTEAAFWSAIRSCLRNKFMTWGKKGWLPAQEAIKRQTRRIGRTDYVECEGCHELIRKRPKKGTRKAWQLHHIVECGALLPDIEGFVNRLFQEDTALFAVLCTECHGKEKKR